MFPESEEFRFGVHKCRKTILDGVSRGSIYLGGGVLTMFRVMRKLTEMRSVDKIGAAAGFGGTLGSTSMASMLCFKHNYTVYLVGNGDVV